MKKVIIQVFIFVIIVSILISFGCKNNPPTVPTPAPTSTFTITMTPDKTATAKAQATATAQARATSTAQAQITATAIAQKTATMTAIFVMKWGTSGSGNGQFINPEGIAVDSSGNVYVTDRGNDRVQKFSNTGAYITQWGGSGIANGQFNMPVGIAVDSVGNVFVSDLTNSNVQKFSTTDGITYTHVVSWPSTPQAPGNGQGQFDYPNGIAIDSSNNIYVTDRMNNRIQKFGNDGTYITQWGSTTGVCGVIYPVGIAVNSSGIVYITDWCGDAVHEFDGVGTQNAQWGAFGDNYQEFGCSPYLFNNPEGIATDSSKNIYIADRMNNRILKFSETRTFIMQWGGFPLSADSGGFDQPTGIAVDTNGNVFVTDYYGNRIQKFHP